MTRSKSGSCGKFIIGGEYAVLEGCPCIAYPLTDLRLKFVSPSESNVILTAEQKSNFVEVAKKIGLELSEDELPHIYSEIPLGAGFGSSAALCVELAKQISVNSDNLERFTIAKNAEDFFHGKSSGVDPACISYEVPILFQNQPLKIEPLKIHQSLKNHFWVLRDSRSRHKTSEGIKSCLSDPNWQQTTEGIRLAVEKMTQGLSEGNVKILIEGVRQNSELLKSLPCHTTEIQSTCQELEALGCSASKLSGGGFGGYVLGVIDRPSLEKNKASLKRSDLVISLLGHDETREWI